MCEKGIQWIYSAFNDCIVSPTDKWSFAIGMVSNIVWVISAFPEIYTICRTKKVDGISPFLFTFLVSGDVLSLIGNILTGGLATQIITCILYILCDGTMLLQYIYHKCIKPRCYKDGEKSEVNEVNQEVDESGIPVMGAAGIVVATAVTAAVDYSLPYTGTTLIGSIFGWFSSIVYISSRVPQVVLNFKRRHVSNLSPYYFLCTITGNTTYFLSLLIRDRSGQFMWKQAPWLVGSLGPLSLDITTAIQMCVFGVTTTSLCGNEDEEGNDEQSMKGDDESSNTKSSSSPRNNEARSLPEL